MTATEQRIDDFDGGLAAVCSIATFYRISSNPQTLRNELVSMKNTLYANGTGSKAALIDATEKLQTQQALLAGQTGQVASIEAEMSIVESQITQTIEQFRADNLHRLADREKQADELRHKVSELSARLENFALSSPIDGIVQGVAVTTVGQVVTISQEVARVVPDLTQLEVEAYVQNKDIGFLTIDQQAAVKVETLPFSRYGTVSATVTHIASDAMSSIDARAAESGTPRMVRSTSVAAGEQRVQNLVYAITLRLNQESVNADGRAIRLMPGMTVTAEIKTGYRSVLEYFLSPLVEVSSSALHER
jgi:hemolysin D